ncbi:uncharacterized protein AB9X84_017429 isoform 1-T1 [Acanthopagrus schlegelii]
MLAAPLKRQQRQTTTKMGNANSPCQVLNHSKRNVRVFVTEKALEMDAFIAPQTAADDKSWKKSLSVLPADKKFSFNKDAKCVRVLASQTQPVPWEQDHFLSVFVEDEDDQNICSKQIMHNMALRTSPVVVLLYHV